MKTVLIVGSTSTVGLSVGCLLGDGYKTYYAGRRNGDYFLDLESPDLTFSDDMHFDIIIHCASSFGDKDEESYCKTEKVNALGTLNVCGLAKKVNADHLIIISTISATYKPGDPFYGIYSLSKRHADELSQLYCCSHEIPLTILRPTQLYDAESKCRTHQELFYLIIDKAQAGDDICLFGSNDALRNLVFVDDLSEIILRVINQKITGIFNCQSQKPVRLSQIAKSAYSVFGTSGAVNFLTDKPRISDVPTFDECGLYSLIGFKPRSLVKGIEKIKQAREA
jgi:nucleoside-diphosphate-sugar epimerase